MGSQTDRWIDDEQTDPKQPKQDRTKKWTDTDYGIDLSHHFSNLLLFVIYLLVSGGGGRDSALIHTHYGCDSFRLFRLGGAWHLILSLFLICPCL